MARTLIKDVVEELDERVEYYWRTGSRTFEDLEKRVTRIETRLEKTLVRLFQLECAAEKK